MTQMLPKLGIYGWREEDENLLLASLLTGDPLLMIGTHGTAKTGLANKAAEALGWRFISYDASKCLFEDVLGYPNIKKLQEGEVEYIGSPVTIFDKEFVLIDELNRALPEMQSKWLEVIRSRKIMGFPTQVKWVWAAMNPASYSGTQSLDEALSGRFALFVYPPEVLSMSEEDRIRVARHINGDDALALGAWGENARETTVPADTLQAVGEEMRSIITAAARHFSGLRADMTTIGEFLAKFSELLNRETKGEVQLDGRRLGFIYRNILALRAVELAKAGLSGESARAFQESARYAVLSSIPVGLNDASVNREEVAHQVEVVFDLLSAYFTNGSEIEKVNLVYELFTTKDLVRKAEILIKGSLNEMVRTKAWNDLVKGDLDITSLAYVALQVEARRPGTIPGEMIDHVAGKVSLSELSSTCLGSIEGESVEYVDELEKLLDQPGDIETLLAIARVREATADGKTDPGKIAAVKKAIDKDIETFRKLMEAPAEKQAA